MINPKISLILLQVLQLKSSSQYTLIRDFRAVNSKVKQEDIKLSHFLSIFRHLKMDMDIEKTVKLKSVSTKKTKHTTNRDNCSARRKRIMNGENSKMQIEAEFISALKSSQNTSKQDESSYADSSERSISVKKYLIDASVILGLVSGKINFPEKTTDCISKIDQFKYKFSITDYSLFCLQSYLGNISNSSLEEVIKWLENSLNVTVIPCKLDDSSILKESDVSFWSCLLESDSAFDVQLDAILTLRPEFYQSDKLAVLSWDKFIQNQGDGECSKVISLESKAGFGKTKSALSFRNTRRDFRAEIEQNLFRNSLESRESKRIFKILISSDIVFNIFLGNDSWMKIGERLSYQFRSQCFEAYILDHTLSELQYYLSLISSQVAEEATMWLENELKIRVINTRLDTFECAHHHYNFLKPSSWITDIEFGLLFESIAIQEDIEVFLYFKLDAPPNLGIPAISAQDFLSIDCRDLREDDISIIALNESDDNQKLIKEILSSFAGRMMLSDRHTPDSILKECLLRIMRILNRGGEIAVSRDWFYQTCLNAVRSLSIEEPFLGSGVIQDQTVLWNDLVNKANLPDLIDHIGMLCKEDFLDSGIKLFLGNSIVNDDESWIRSYLLERDLKHPEVLELADSENQNLDQVELRLKLVKKDFRGQDLSYLNLSQVDLSDAILENCRFFKTDLSRANLQGANLVGAYLEQAIMICANVSFSEMVGVNLDLSDCTGADFKGTNLRSASCLKAVFVNANFENANLEKACLREANLSGAIIMNASLLEADMSNALLRSSCLRSSDMKRVNLERASLQGAYLSHVDLRNSNLRNVQARRACFDDANLENINLENSNLENASFERSVLKNAILREANLSEALFNSAILCGADLSLSVLKGAFLKRVNLKNAILECVELQGAYIKDGNLENAILEHVELNYSCLKRSNLANSKIRNTSFKGADLRYSNLYKAKLDNVLLEGADLTGSNLESCSARDIDFSFANLSNVLLRYADLSKSVMRNSILNYTDMYRICLKNSNLRGAKLSATNLEGANLSEADFYGATLTDVNLVGANLKHACLDRVNLSGSVLKNALLSGASIVSSNLLGVNLECADLEGAKIFRTYFRCLNSNKSKLDAIILHQFNCSDSVYVSFSFEEKFLSCSIDPLYRQDFCARLADIQEVSKNLDESIQEIIRIKRGFENKPPKQNIGVIKKLSVAISALEDYSEGLKTQINCLNKLFEFDSERKFCDALEYIRQVISDVGELIRLISELSLRPRAFELYRFQVMQDFQHRLLLRSPQVTLDY